jgi:adenylate cyclase
MAEKRAQRRLAAILAADVVGYSRLMEQDEAGTLAALKMRRQDVLAPVVAQHHGRVVKVMGDGVLVEFASAVDAVQCAVELRKAFAGSNEGLAESSRIVLRIGVNLGYVIVEGQDIYGDGVNVAARLEGMAEPGSIYISGTVHDHVSGKLMLAFDDLGERTLKNIAKPVKVYRAGSGWADKSTARPAPALPDKPSTSLERSMPVSWILRLSASACLHTRKCADLWILAQISEKMAGTGSRDRLYAFTTTSV